VLNSAILGGTAYEASLIVVPRKFQDPSRNDTFRRIDGPKIKWNLLSVPIFPLEGGALGPLKLKSEDKAFWIASRSRRSTGLEETEGAALKIVNIEYTYPVLAELQIPWLINRSNYWEKDTERTFLVLGAIFEAYRAKRIHEEDYLNQLSKLETAAFPSHKGTREHLKELLLPPRLRLKPEDNLYAAGQEYNSLALPESFLEPPPSEAKQVSSDRELERKRKLLEDWRQFLIDCGVKGKPRFMFNTVKYKPFDFNSTDSIRYELWNRHIKHDYTSHNPVELITVQLDAGTQSVLATDDYDKKMMAESLYSTWMESFGKQSLNLDNNYNYRDNPPAGYFLTRYRRHENRSPVIKDQDWGGVTRKLIPLKTVTGSTTTAVLGLRISDEQLATNCYVTTRYLPLVSESTGSGHGYHSVYLNSLNVRPLRVSDINALWDKVEDNYYPDIIKIALEVAAMGFSLAGLELYDYEQSRLRSAKDFHLGLEGTKGSALIEKQYGQDGQQLGKQLGLTAETDANLFLGLFGRILDGVIISSDDRGY